MTAVAPRPVLGSPTAHLRPRPAARGSRTTTELPRIRSERPAVELHSPQLSERMRREWHIGSQRVTPGEQAAGLAGQEGLVGEDPRNR